MSKDKKLVVVFRVDSTFISLVKLGELSKLSWQNICIGLQHMLSAPVLFAF